MSSIVQKLGATLAGSGTGVAVLRHSPDTTRLSPPSSSESLANSRRQGPEIPQSQHSNTGERRKKKKNCRWGAGSRQTSDGLVFLLLGLSWVPSGPVGGTYTHSHVASDVRLMESFMQRPTSMEWYNPLTFTLPDKRLPNKSSIFATFSPGLYSHCHHFRG